MRRCLSILAAFLLPCAALAQSQIMLDSRPHAAAQYHTNQLIIGGATGGNKGLGSINAQGLYINGGPITGAFGGTGTNNGSATLTLGGSVITTGTGTATLAFSSSPFTYTYPGASATLPGLGVAETWIAVQTYTNSDICLLGSSTGCTTFTSANSGASAFTLTFPAVTDTLATLGTGSQQLSGGVLITDGNDGTKSSGTYTIVCGSGPQRYITNGGAFTLAAPASSSNCLLQVTNNASAGAISFSGFTVGSNTGAVLDTVNGHIFTISIWKINGTAGYSVYAHQ